MTDEKDKLMTFAALEWPTRWNNIAEGTAVAGLTQSGARMCLTTCLGFVMFDRDKDGPHLLRQLEAACDLLRKELA